MEQHDRFAPGRPPDDAALGLEPLDGTAQRLGAPVEELVDLPGRQSAGELDRAGQDPAPCLRRGDGLGRAHDLRIPTHEEVVRVVVFLLAFADRLHPRDVHEALHFVERAVVLVAAVL